MPQGQQKIVFQDLHGRVDDEGVDLEVDLDAETPGIKRTLRASDDQERRTEPEDDDQPSRSTAARRDAEDDLDEAGSGDHDDDPAEARQKRNAYEARLERERRIKRRERQRAEAAEARVQALEKQLKQKAPSGPSKEDLDSQITETETAIEKAIEDGDTKSQVRLISKLTTLKGQRIAADIVPQQRDDADVQPGSDVRSNRNELVDEWKDRHSHWYGRKGFEKQTARANKIDREVFNDGFDPTEEDYFQELDKRLRKVHAEVFDDDVDTTPRRGKERSPVAPAGNGGTARMRAGKVTLEKEDFDNMRRFKLNVDDPEVVKEYARNKREEALLSGGRQ